MRWIAFVFPNFNWLPDSSFLSSFNVTLQEFTILATWEVYEILVFFSLQPQNSTDNLSKGFTLKSLLCCFIFINI